MSTERRFSEDEVAFILERAAKAEAADDTESVNVPVVPGGDDGMSMTRLQEIAAEVGISAEAIESAARAVARGDLAPTSTATFAGLPVGVSRTITIDRAVSDTEWERMVVLFRQTFNARGSTGRDGSLRHWSNGNLHAMLEPTATGHQLRLQTTKGDARVSLGVGLSGTVLGAVSSVGILMGSAASRPGVWIGPAVLLIAGVTLMTRTALGLVPWARTRAAQMEALADEVTKILDESPTPPTLPPAR